MKKFNGFISFIVIFLPMFISLPLMDSNNLALSGTGGELFLLSISMIIIFFSNNKKIYIPIRKMSFKFTLDIFFIALANFILITCIVGIFHFLKIGDFSSIDDSTNLNVLLIISIVIIGPICEEFFFRAGILNLLIKKIPPCIAIVLQGIIFAFIHLVSPKSVTFYVSLIGGITLGYVFYYSKSILCSILCHAIYNLLSVLFYNYTFYTKNIIIFLSYIPLGILSLLLIIYLIKKVKCALI